MTKLRSMEVHVSRYTVRSVRAHDFSELMALERALFGQTEDGVLGPYYVRLCCEFFSDSCFVVEVEGKIVGYLLSFIRDREAYCTTLGVVPMYQGTRAIVRLIRAFTTAVVDKVDACWFTVEEENSAARALHQVIGAKELEYRPDFYGPGRGRIISRVDRESFVRVREHLERLGLVERKRIAAPSRPTLNHVACEAIA